MSARLAGNDWFDEAQARSNPLKAMCPALIENVDF